jgi:hypothetical protein
MDHVFDKMRSPLEDQAMKAVTEYWSEAELVRSKWLKLPALS